MRQKKLLCIGMSLFVSLCSIPLTSIHAQEIMETLPGQETLETDGMEDFKNPTQEVTPQAGKVRAADNIWEGYKYKELDDGTVEITGYWGKEGEIISGKLVIPSEINGKRVTSIGDSAFFQCSGLTQISIPEGVISIGNSAFCFCTGLTQISIPEGVASIGIGAFGQCTGLTQISIPKSVASIGNSAFSGCYRLTQISIPAGVTSIGNGAFGFCSVLTEINVDSNNPAYVSQNGILYDKKREQLICCPAGKKGKISIPAGVTSIEASAFSGCYGLTQISIPAGVTSIKSWAFYQCSGLTQISIPAGVAKIEASAFSGCYELTQISIPKSVTEIEASAFYGCENATWLVHKGSYAETYAKKNNFKYKYISCSHTWRETIIAKATVKKNGSITKTCTTCGEQSTETIYAVKNIKLSQTSYTYNGKSKKPYVTVKDSKGKALKNKTDYTVTYPKNMKNVGSYTITIKLKGNYKGTVKKTFQIIPKGTSISEITPKKKGFALEWNKQAVQTTGYEVAYSTNKKFTKKTTGTITVGKSKIVSKSVSKLKAKKKYYVKIRTYKAVKINGKAKKLYSAWSKIKTVTTKR